MLSPLVGKLAGTYGPRLFMTVGPITCALGFVLLLRIDPSFNYPIHILPGILVFGIGLSITVAPLTSAVLGSLITVMQALRQPLTTPSLVLLAFWQSQPLPLSSEGPS